MNSDKDLYTNFVEMFGVEPRPAHKEIMHKIGKPLDRLAEIYELIKHITSSLKSQLKEDALSMQTNTYLITTPNFEKLFNLNKPIQDVQKFVSKKEIYNTLLKEHEEEEYISEGS